MSKGYGVKVDMKVYTEKHDTGYWSDRGVPIWKGVSFVMYHDSFDSFESVLPTYMEKIKYALRKEFKEEYDKRGFTKARNRRTVGPIQKIHL